MALPTALDAAHVGKRQAGPRNVGADRLDPGEDGKRVRNPMLAGLRDGKSQLTLEQHAHSRGDRRAAGHQVLRRRHVPIKYGEANARRNGRAEVRGVNSIERRADEVHLPPAFRNLNGLRVDL